MTTNFEIEGNYAVRQDGRMYDLHNNFDVASFHYETSAREFKIIWKKSKGDWIKPDDDPEELVILHKEVSFLLITDMDKERDESNDTCLRDITFFASSHRNMNDSLVIQEKPNADDDLLYFFENEQIIRVGCASAKLLVSLNNKNL